MRQTFWGTTLSAVTAVVVAVTAGGGPAVAAPGRLDPSPAVSAVTVPDGKYYVVGEPVDGQQEYLYQIAADTLGDGERYREIFELNRGRVQADGLALTDPTQIETGWVLALPDDAQGPRVMTGRVPFSGPSLAPPVVPAQAVKKSSSPPASLVAAGGVSLVLLALILLVLVRRFRRERLATASSGAAPPAPGAAVPSTQAAAAPPAPAAAAPSTQAAAAPPAPATAVPFTRAGAALPAPEETTRLVETRRPVEPEQPTQALPRNALVTARPAVPADELRAELSTAAGPVSVRLGDPHAAWRGPHEQPPPMLLPALLGTDADGWQLWADLGRTPGLFTVTGPPESSHPLARAIAGTVHAAGHTVTVIGDEFGDLPDGWLHRDRFPALGDLPEGRGILLATALTGDDLTVARTLTTRTAGRLVPIVAGKVLRARWSVTGARR